jgi:hypothetical protein
MLLERCDGPPCPRCGSQDADIKVMPPPIDPRADDLRQKYGVTSWFAAGRARCRFCNLNFSFRELPPSPAEEPSQEPPSLRPTPPDLAADDREDPAAGAGGSAVTFVGIDAPRRQSLPLSAAVPDQALAAGNADTGSAGRGVSPVNYPVKGCPSCGSPNVKVTSTRKPIRHHKCEACAARFKSVERSL